MLTKCAKLVEVHLTMLVEHENQHLDRVQAVVEGNGMCAQGSIAASWKRSAIDFGVDPTSNDSPTMRVLRLREPSLPWTQEPDFGLYLNAMTGFFARRMAMAISALD